jgi:hypothetical protein
MLWIPLPPLPRFFAIAGLFILASSGCISLNPALDLAALSGTEVGAPIVPPPGPLGATAPARQVVVQLRPMEGGQEMVSVKMEGDESVESVLIKSKATTRFHRMKVSLFRPGRHGPMANEPLRVEFDSAARRVPAQYDYALQPGDKLLVVEMKGSAFEDLMSSVLGPLAR